MSPGRGKSRWQGGKVLNSPRHALRRTHWSLVRWDSEPVGGALGHQHRRGQAVHDHFTDWVFTELPESVFGGTLWVLLQRGRELGGRLRG